MSGYEFSHLVFIGRFQPFHEGHLKVVKTAFEKSQNLVMVLGGHDRPRTTKNPWTSEEREAMIRTCLSEEENKRTLFVYQEDYVYNDSKWLSTVREKINAAIYGKNWQAGPYKIGIIGHKKDHTSYYLSMFPTWGNVGVDNYKNIDATTIRNVLLSNGSVVDNAEVLQGLPKSVFRYILEWGKKNEESMKSLRTEYGFLVKFKESWKNSPYTPTFNTVDAIVIQGGHILLVKRKHEPGKGLWALPGGYLDPKETLLDSAIRELKEETKIDIPIPVLKGSIKKQETFDHPWRSSRGRVITRAFLFDLQNRSHVKLPAVKGSDDAEAAEWVPLSDLKSSNLFEDHYDIIQSMLGI